MTEQEVTLNNDKTNMKKLTAKIALASFSLLWAAVMASGQTGATLVFIQVKGLSCPFCVQGLEKHLKKLDAVAAVSTSLKKGEAVLELKSGRAVEEKELRQAVKAAGFTAGQIRFEARPAPGGGEKSGPEGKN